MIEEPPALTFPSLKKLQPVAKDVLDILHIKSAQSRKTFKFCPAVANSEPEKKKQGKKGVSCEKCRKKKVKCDTNFEKDERCNKSNCTCIHHIPYNGKEDKNGSSEASSPSDYNRSNNNSATPTIDFIPSTTGFRKAGLLSSRHYAGETSFCAYLQPENQPNSIQYDCSYPTLDTIPVQIPSISYQDKRYLIEVYYQNLNPFFPIINKDELLTQLEYLEANKQTYLSPLFFYALFARAAHVQTDRISTETNQQTFKDLGNDCITYFSALVSKYQDTPRISTVLALIIMANHLEQTKLSQNLTRTWLWSGEAFRIALDLGIHRASISEKDSPEGQLCIRTFWLAYITDCTISMTYGRPSATEEKVL
ncbi:fungal-specific transcription factor domain-containing protein [Pilaira anomala]|nr:fungal-specific transcription factor domain-containing protein [Pilaira anomala]